MVKKIVGQVDINLGQISDKLDMGVEWFDRGIRLNEMARLGPFGDSKKPEYVIHVYHEHYGNPTFHFVHTWGASR